MEESIWVITLFQLGLGVLLIDSIHMLLMATLQYLYPQKWKHKRHLSGDSLGFVLYLAGSIWLAVLMAMAPDGKTKENSIIMSNLFTLLVVFFCVYLVCCDTSGEDADFKILRTRGNLIGIFVFLMLYIPCFLIIHIYIAAEEIKHMFYTLPAILIGVIMNKLKCKNENTQENSEFMKPD